LVIDVFGADPSVPKARHAEAAILCGCEELSGRTNIGLTAVEQKSLESLIQDQVRGHAFGATATADFDNATRLKPNHREDVQDDAVLFELGMNSKPCVPDFRV
jgi:hypothetical protein